MYALQPAETRIEHAAAVEAHRSEVLRLIEWCDLLIEDRNAGLPERIAVNLPEAFWGWAEVRDQDDDQALYELRESLWAQADAAVAQKSLAGLTDRTLRLRSRKQGDGVLHA